MAQIELNDFLDENIRKEVMEILGSHNKLLTKVIHCLSPLSEIRPEVFRKPLTSRLKQLNSIYNNLRKQKVQQNELLTTIKEMDDLAGVRLTIATKDQFEEAETIIKEALCQIEGPRKLIKKIKGTTRNQRKPESDSGYHGIHYIIGDKYLKCEIQIRTLTQDLWAVFSHYESYKYESSALTKRELINYSKLMDVADDYAQLARNRKIKEAEELHKNKSEKNGTKGITFKEFEDILTKTHNITPGLKKFKWIRFDVLELCDALKLIHIYEIYSSEDLIEVINKKDTIRFIKQAMENNGLNDLSFLKAFYILCWCHLHHKYALGPRNSGPSETDFIDMMIRVYKLEDDFDKLSINSGLTETLFLLSTILSLSKFRELNDCVSFNKLIRFEIPQKDILRISDWADKLGLSFHINDKSFNLIIDKGMDSWASSVAFCSDSEDSAMRFVYFHPDKKRCEIANQYDTDENDLNLGLLLNYPKCCIEAYLSWQREKNDIDPITIITDSFPFNGELNNFDFPNPFNRYFDSGLFSHFPCSLNCAATKKLAQESLNNLQTNFPVIASRMLQLENSLVIFHKERGVCLWRSFTTSKNKIQMDKRSFQGQGELKSIFETVNEIEILNTELKLYCNSTVLDIFRTNGCFIATFRDFVNAPEYTPKTIW